MWKKRWDPRNCSCTTSVRWKVLRISASD
ncbi:MAG: hypothetical protein E3J35_02765 [Methanomassiliicoccales archaeon]|nr:MAG: hypothetical protein E3J35_02765 [Methanomassiliicoccales archaeon]